MLWIYHPSKRWLLWEFIQGASIRCKVLPNRPRNGWKGIYMAIDGDEQARGVAESIVRTLGSTPFSCRLEERMLYSCSSLFLFQLRRDGPGSGLSSSCDAGQRVTAMRQRHSCRSSMGLCRMSGNERFGGLDGTCPAGDAGTVVTVWRSCRLN